MKNQANISLFFKEGVANSDFICLYQNKSIQGHLSATHVLKKFLSVLEHTLSLLLRPL